VRQKISVLTIIFLVVSTIVGYAYIGSAQGRGGNFTVNPYSEVTEEIALTLPHKIIGNLSISNGFVDFFIIDPSNQTIYSEEKVQSSSFAFTAQENGTYVMHILNKYQTFAVTATLSYNVNFFVTVSAELNFSMSITTTQTTTSDGVIITQVGPKPVIAISVNPPGFPALGNYWEIQVYSINTTSDGREYQIPLPYASVLITTNVGGKSQNYNFTCDSQGVYEFQFLSNFDDISFQASYFGSLSVTKALTLRSEQWVSNEDIGSMMALSGILSGAITGLTIYFRRKIKLVFRLLIGIVLAFSFIQFGVSLGSKWFLLTAWGYKNTLYGIITWSLLKYVSFGVWIFMAILLVINYFLGYRNAREDSDPPRNPKKEREYIQ
jgi:hypothetical protein